MYSRSRPSSASSSTATASTPAQDVGASNSEVAVAASGEVNAEFDTPGHQDVGDSVSGAGVDINGVPFTPGQIATLVDYVPLEDLWEYEVAELEALRVLLDRETAAKASGDDSLRPTAAEWDAATHGAYSEIARNNENHFAPGEGPNFEDSFVGLLSEALRLAQEAEGLEGEEAAARMNEARILAYSSEHFLQDAFAGGHQVSAGSVEAAVDAVLPGLEFGYLIRGIVGNVFSRQSAAIAEYELLLPKADPLNPLQWSPIDTLDEFEGVAGVAAASLGKEGFYDGMRKYMHEEIGDQVEVTSLAHPEPWVLPCDETLEAGSLTFQLIQAALTDARNVLEVVAVPGTDPRALAKQVFDRHRPVPTANGQKLIDEALAQATANPEAVTEAMTVATCATIYEVMDGISSMVPGVRKIAGAPEPAPDPPLEPTGPTFWETLPSNPAGLVGTV